MKLIVNGDDFGITKACSYAMIDCFKDGIMTSASMMTNMPDASHAAGLMKECPELSVGIHFNLTVGKPLTNCPSLVKEDGTFNKGNLKDSSLVKYEEVEKELQAQYDRFIELTNQKPTHLNSHHGICLIQGAEEVLLKFSKRYDLPLRQLMTRMVSQDDSNLIYEVAPVIATSLKESHVTSQLFMDSFTAEMLESDNVYEYVSHPGYVDYQIKQISSLTDGRYYDANVYMDPKVKKWIQDHRVELVDYSVLKRK